MTKNEMQSWLLDMLQGQKEKFASVTVDGELDQIILKTPCGQEFAVQVQEAACAANTHALGHYAALSLSTAVSGMFELGLLNQKAAAEYLEILATYV